MPIIEEETCIAATRTSKKECDIKKSDLIFPILQFGSVEIADEFGKRTQSDISTFTQSGIINGSFSVSVYIKNDNKSFRAYFIVIFFSDT